MLSNAQCSCIILDVKPIITLVFDWTTKCHDVSSFINWFEKYKMESTS